MKTRLSLPGSLAVLAVSLPVLCQAQSGSEPAPVRVRTQIVRVKPDMVNEWMDLQKNEVVPALKKGGVATRTVYQTNIGNGFEFMIVTPFAKFAEFDAEGAQLKALGAAGNARLGEKQRKCIESTSNWVSTQLPALSNNPNSIFAAPKSILTRIRVAPGKMQEFQALVKSDLLPAFKKGKQDVAVFVRGLGANPNDIVLSSPIAKYAEFDSPPPFMQALGQDGTAKLIARFEGMGSIVEQTVRTRIADLSF